MSRHRRALGFVTGLLLFLPACGQDVGTQAVIVAGSEPARGRAAIIRNGCVTCHTISGIRGANGLVGPPLDRIASRAYIAGVLQNSPDNMTRWIRNPPGVDPLTAMPNLHLNDDEVHDIVGFLYTLR